MNNSSESKKNSGIFIPRASFYLWVIFLLIIAVGVYNIWAAIPGFVLLLVLVYYNFHSSYTRQKEITSYIENLTFNIDTATKDTLLNFPMPLSIVELDGTIIWYNSSFRKIFEGEDLLEKPIHDFVEDLHPSKLINGTSNISKDAIIKDRYYNVLGNLVKVEGKSDVESYMLILYFIDNTELIDIKKKLEDEKISVGIIVIDNYDDLMQSMEDTSRPQMLAEIDRKIVQWMGHTGGTIRKFERDRYFFVFEYRYLKELEEKKFEILDIIKEINIGNKIPVTLSIGFGINGKSIAENFSYATACIDIALGRGGDHVVIRNGDNFSFFGGKTRELEKRTKVKARVIAYALRELIDQCPEVLIMGHENPDIDCLGASLGLRRIVKNRNKDAYIVMNRSNATIDGILSKLEKSDDYNGLFINRLEALDRINKKTLLIVVDTHRPSFTECPELLNYTDQIVVIDHHRRGADFIQDAVLTYQETYASSSSELVSELLQYVEEKIKLTPLEAEALYAGIVVDTKNFTFKTGVRTFEAAAFLRRQGVDTVSVKQLFQNDLDTYIAVSNVLKDAEIINENIAISVCPAGLKKPQLIAAQAADAFLGLSGLTAAFVLCTVGNEIYISGRSLGEINVQMILEKLGGGGHLTGAGAQLQDISIENAKEKLKYAIIEYMEETNKVES
ncbi:MAG: DHH family phosphoesterase [Bacillota bacterium]|nr:DHH family phosphoesterase [Bacillota bacterium]